MDHISKRDKMTFLNLCFQTVNLVQAPLCALRAKELLGRAEREKSQVCGYILLHMRKP